MNLLQTNDVTDRVYVSPVKTRRSLRPARQAGASPKVQPDQPWVVKRTFAEDYTQEHSLPGAPAVSIEISCCF